jgi:hypothetical protein
VIYAPWQGGGTGLASMSSTVWNSFSGPAPRQGALVGIAAPRWFHHRLMSAVPLGTDADRSTDVSGPLNSLWLLRAFNSNSFVLRPV